MCWINNTKTVHTKILFYILGDQTMRNKTPYILGGLFLLAAFILYTSAALSPARITNSVYRSSPAKLADKLDEINQIYKCSFTLTNTKVDFLPSFVPVYGSENSIELTFQSDEKDSDKIIEMSEEEAVKAAELFIAQKELPLNYSEVLIVSTDNKYEITFLSRIAGLNNYAHPTCITIDIYGNISALDYFIPEYEKLDSTHMITQREAFSSLPTEGFDGSKIDLKSCELVYFFADSIVQPAYLFKGEIAGGEDFECFIKASKYY